MSINNFIKQNEYFFKKYSDNLEGGNLLIEDNSLCFVIHCLAMQALLIKKAKGLKPVWLYNKDIPLNLLKSYSSNAEQVQLVRLNFLFRLLVLLRAFKGYVCVLLKSDILSFTYDKVKYGDIVYDAYLAKKQVGTIKRIDFSIFYLIAQCIYRHESIKKTIIQNNIKATLNSHRIGIVPGVMLRTALRYGCEVYTINGMHRGTLHRATTIDKMIDYEYTPTKEEINEITNLDEEQFDKLYQFVLDFHINGNCSMDAKYAFSDSKKIYTDRKSFADAYKVESEKKNIFIMLHAFTDYPHSHFKWMIFKDYADWFLKTLEFAKSNSEVNWIFKRHPSDKFYPTKDMDFKKLFTNVPSNIVFLDENDKLDTRSLIYVADAVVTCLGSAGFELPAMGGIPSVTAGDNHYWGFGFSYNPSNKDEYFNILKDLKNVNKLSKDQQKQAKAVYMFIHYFCTVNYSFIPKLTLDDHHNKMLNEIYWDKILELYKQNEKVIYDEVDKYSNEISLANFKANRTSIQSII